MQNTPTPATAGLEELYGAIASAQRSYTRTRPPNTPNPAIDWFSISLGQFENIATANAVLPDLRDEGLERIGEQWPTMELAETILLTPGVNASRQLFSGTVSRPGQSNFGAWLLLQVNDIIGILGGFSNWSPTTLEIAYLSDLVSSLAIAKEGDDLSALLPTKELLIGGLQVRE